MHLDPEPERAADVESWRNTRQGDNEDRDADIRAAVLAIHTEQGGYSPWLGRVVNAYCGNCNTAWPCATALAVGVTA